MMQPYQEASQELKRQAGAPFKTAKNIATLGVGSSTLTKVIPFLNKFIPTSLALKGINKLNPKIGKFINGSLNHGIEEEEVLNFLREKSGIEKQQNNTQEPTKTNTNIVQQYSPELHEFIISELKKGRNPLQAGALAQFENKYKNVIKKLEKDHKSPFSAILQSVYGSAEQPQQFNQSQQPQQQSGLSPAMQKLAQFMEQGYQILGGQ